MQCTRTSLELPISFELYPEVTGLIIGVSIGVVTFINIFTQILALYIISLRLLLYWLLSLYCLKFQPNSSQYLPVYYEAKLLACVFYAGFKLLSYRYQEYALET